MYVCMYMYRHSPSMYMYMHIKDNTIPKQLHPETALYSQRENELPLRRDSNPRYHADALLAELPRQLSWAGRILNDYYLTIKYMYMYIHVRTCRCTIRTGYATNLLFHVHVPVSLHTCIYISSHMNIHTLAVHVPTYLNIQITYTCTLIG